MRSWPKSLLGKPRNSRMATADRVRRDTEIGIFKDRGEFHATAIIACTRRTGPAGHDHRRVEEGSADKTSRVCISPTPKRISGARARLRIRHQDRRMRLRPQAQAGRYKSQTRFMSSLKPRPQSPCAGPSRPRPRPCRPAGAAGPTQAAAEQLRPTFSARSPPATTTCSRPRRCRS